MRVGTIAEQDNLTERPWLTLAWIRLFRLQGHL